MGKLTFQLFFFAGFGCAIFFIYSSYLNSLWKGFPSALWQFVHVASLGFSSPTDAAGTVPAVTSSMTFLDLYALPAP